MRPHVLFFLCAWLSACAQQTPPASTMRLCDSDGCSDQPTDTAKYDTSSAVPDDDPDGRISALEEIARKDPRAAHDLALRFFRGDGVRRDSYRALKWMRDSAERGDLAAQKAVGRLYLTGLEEMGSDPREAEKWLTLAAGRGDKEAEELLAEAVEARKDDEAYRRWRTRWRSVFHQYWYVDYPYYWRWYEGVWVY